MIMSITCGAATFLTIAMFATKSMLLGFPCLIFWAIFGGYCYTISTATWDMYYFLFFGAMGMAIFCVLAAYALRTRKEEAEEGDHLIDEGADKDVKYIDEEQDGVSRFQRKVRDNAERRRTKGVRRPLRLK